MLRIFNSIKPFVEDCYREISVREYARIVKISPPSASKLLKSLEKENLLKKREDKGYLLFRANRESELLKDLSRIYWKISLKDLIDYFDARFSSPSIILFGSLSKLETKSDSDIDIVVLTESTVKLKDLDKFERKYNRKIQIFSFRKLKDIPKELMRNVMNGYILKGKME